MSGGRNRVFERGIVSVEVFFFANKKAIDIIICDVVCSMLKRTNKWAKNGAQSIENDLNQVWF